jgi:hypothetical protein
MRRGARLVAEDDPGWVQFWAVYPKRQSKKDARAAWADLEPSPELVAQIIAALTWQVSEHRWDGDRYDFCPLPASYIRAERWTDEPVAGPKVTWAVHWVCPHVVRCPHPAACRVASLNRARYQVRES